MNLGWLSCDCGDFEGQVGLLSLSGSGFAGNLLLGFVVGCEFVTISCLHGPGNSMLSAWFCCER